MTQRSCCLRGYDGTDYEIFIAEFIGDMDSDGVTDFADNCPSMTNPGQGEMLTLTAQEMCAR